MTPNIAGFIIAIIGVWLNIIFLQLLGTFFMGISIGIILGKEKHERTKNE